MGAALIPSAAKPRHCVCPLLFQGADTIAITCCCWCDGFDPSSNVLTELE